MPRLCALPRAPPLPLDVVDILCCVARGIPFTPPVKFVLMALQQLLFFYQSEKVSISISTVSTILTHIGGNIRFGGGRQSTLFCYDAAVRYISSEAMSRVVVPQEIYFSLLPSDSMRCAMFFRVACDHPSSLMDMTPLCCFSPLAVCSPDRYSYNGLYRLPLACSNGAWSCSQALSCWRLQQ